MEITKKLAAAAFAALIAAGTAQAGHGDAEGVPVVRRLGGQVTELGKPDGKGDLYQFKAKQVGAGAPVRYQPDELKGWRLTFLGGKRFTNVFQVLSNTDYEITVTPLDGPLNGVAVYDSFLAEELVILRDAE